MVEQLLERSCLGAFRLLLQDVLDALQLLLQFSHVMPGLILVFSANVQFALNNILILLASGADLRLFLRYLFPKFLDPLRLTAAASLTDPHVQLIDLVLHLAFALSLLLERLLLVFNSGLQLLLLVRQPLNLGTKLLPVGGAYVEPLDGLLHVLDAAPLLLVEEPPLLLELELLLPPVGVQLVLQLLVDAQLRELQLSLLGLARRLQFLLFAPQFLVLVLL